MDNSEATAPQEQTDQQQQTDQPDQGSSGDDSSSVDNSAAESESILGQALEGKKEEDAKNKVPNPLTDDEEEKETTDDPDDPDKKETAQINFDEIKLPEGQDLIPEFKELAIKEKFNQQQTQALIDLKAKLDEKTAQDNQAHFNEVVENLRKETEEKFGTNLKKEMSYAARGMNLLNKDEQTELKEILKVSGIGNHHLLVKMFSEVGKALSEDKFVEGKTSKKTEYDDPALGLARNMIKEK
jgi:hypothetical protein